MINVLRVKSRVEAGGHDVPEDKIVTRYDRALNLVKELVKLWDVCHIYDNSGNRHSGYLRSGKSRFILMNVLIGIL